MAKTGRPYKKIEKKEFEALCRLQCTIGEFEDFFECDDVTINSWCKREYKKSFSEIFAIKRGGGKISLRRNQFRLSENNTAMAIWLGKQYLGQKDAPGSEEKADQGILPDILEALKNVQKNME